MPDIIYPIKNHAELGLFLLIGVAVFVIALGSMVAAVTIAATVVILAVATIDARKSVCCPVCGSTEWYENHSDGFIWWECDTCGHKVI